MDQMALRILSPWAARFNQKAYAAIEQKCADALADGAEVFFKVEPLYEGGSFRPSSFAITDIIDGEETVTFLLNTAKEM